MGDLHRTSELLRNGLSRGRLNTALDHGRLHHVARGVYADAPPDTPDALRAIFHRLPARTVLGYASAASVYGLAILPAPDLHVIVPAGVVRPRITGVRVHEAVVPVTNTRMIDGVPYASPTRCAVDLARSLRRPDALAVLDSALRVAGSTPEDLLVEVALHAGLRGVRQARELAAMAHPGAECRQESHLRLLLIDAGLPAPEPQIWVEDELGVPRYRIDLGYRDRRVGIEYDGQSHLDRDRMRHDRARLNWLSAHGWTMRVFTDRDLYRNPQGIIDLIRTTLHLPRRSCTLAT